MPANDISYKITNTFTTLLDLVYPIGSIYLSVSTVSPATLLGGNWVEINDGYLAIKGSGEWGHFKTTVDTFQGSSYIATTQLPSHTHTGPSHTHALNGSGAAAASGGAHQHSFQMNWGQDWGKNTAWSAYSSYSYTATMNVPASGGSGAHSHSLTGSTQAAGTGNTGATGGGASICSLWIHCIRMKTSCLANFYGVMPYGVVFR